MKTKFSVLIVCVLFAQASMAQFHIGAKGGANIMKIDGMAFKDEFRYGYHLGGFAEIGLGKKWALQPEVLFSQYSTTVDSSFKNIYQNIELSELGDIKLNYLSIPLLLNYKVGSLLTLQAGPQFSILMDANKNLLQNGEAAFKSGEFAMTGGAVINISKLRLTGRYVVGLNNVSDIDDQDKWKNQGFQLSLGLAL